MTWDEARASAAEAQRLASDFATAKADLRDVMADLRGTGQQRAALIALQLQDPSLILRLAPELIELAKADRDAIIVRQILGRVPHRDLERTVTAHVLGAARDEEESDSVAVRRLAELLDDLGLRDGLAELCTLLVASEDPNFADVAADFCRP